MTCTNILFPKQIFQRRTKAYMGIHVTNSCMYSKEVLWGLWGGCAGACDSMTVARISSVMIVRGCLALPPCTPLPLWPAPLPPRPTPLPPLTRTLPLSILLPFGTFYKLCILNGPI